METPKTLLQAARYFADLNICEKFMRDIKWHGDEPACPHCGSKRVGEIKTRRLLRCKDCRKQFSSKVGTIFEDSPLGLDKWFCVIFAVANNMRLSSQKLAELLNTRQETAWRIRRIIKTAMEI